MSRRKIFLILQIGPVYVSGLGPQSLVLSWHVGDVRKEILSDNLVLKTGV